MTVSYQDYTIDVSSPAKKWFKTGKKDTVFNFSILYIVLYSRKIESKRNFVAKL